MPFLTGYDRYMQAQERIRFYEYCVRVDGERLLERIGRMDVSDLAENMDRHDRNIAALRAVSIDDDHRAELPII
jgi:hypothetical protein